ncbi:MAG: MaoC family dehydratase, partial [Spongiibacteraceae bacterium]
MSTDLQKEFDKATGYELTDSDIDKARLMIGVDLASKDKEQIQTATVDTIRNFAQGCGSDNPLFVDPDYAKGTRWGSVIAPTMMAGVINSPMLGDPIDPELKAKTKSMFRGIHVFVSGGEWKFFKPIYPGDTLFSYRGVVSVDMQPSEFAGRKVNRITRDVKVNQRGEVVATYAYREIMTERKTAAKKGKYMAIEPASYSDE